MLAAVADPYRLIFEVLAGTGARESEVLGLTWADVDFDAGTVRFAAQLSRGTAAVPAERVPLKNSRSRHAKRTIRVECALLAKLATAKLAARHSATGDLVFPGHNQRNVIRVWARAGATCELDPRPIVHDLRHSHVSKLIALGADPAMVANRIGDSLETVMRTYAHLFDAANREADLIARLEAVSDASILPAEDGGGAPETGGAVIALSA
jgi:integrase